MSKTPIPPPTREDMIIFQGLQRALVEKKAYIKINFRKLNSFKSPFFNPWENVLPMICILAAFLFFMFAGNMAIGTAVLTVLCLGYVFLLPYFLEPFMRNRVMKRIVPRIEKFLIAWRFGGISIVLAADPNYSCNAPLGNWKYFVRSYFPDLIPRNMEKDK